MNDIGLLTQKRNSIKEQNQQWISTKKQNQKYAEILAGSKQEHYHARTQHRVNSGFVRFFFFFQKTNTTQDNWWRWAVENKENHNI